MIPGTLNTMMMDLGSDVVANSGDFEAGDSSDKLSATLGAGNAKKFTFSCWVKRETVGASQYLMSYYASGSDNNFMQFSANTLLYKIEKSNSTQQLQSSGTFSSTSDWYHIVFAVDTTETTDSDRVDIYVDNVSLSLSGTYPLLNQDQYFNAAVQHVIGNRSTNTLPFDGLMARTYLIDGQKLTPSAFAEDVGGIWTPKEFGGVYGANGFFLNFENGANLGEDQSGNNNDFTNTGVTQSTDTPT